MAHTDKRKRIDTPNLLGDTFSSGTPAAYKQCAKYNDDAADLLLVSSDGHAFKTHSFYLKAASPVFRDMLPNGHNAGQPRAEVLLTDDEFEDHASVRAVLDLAIEGSFPTAKTSAGTWERSRALRRLVMLLLKYDCQALLVHIKLYLQRIERELHNASELFTIYAQMDDVEGMRRTIEFFGDRVWSTQSGYSVAAPYDLNDAVSGASMLDISQSPAGAYSFVAPKYQAALLRAQALKRGGFRGTGGNWQAVSHAFRDIVTGKPYTG